MVCDDYFELTKFEGTPCCDVLSRWKYAGATRFPHIAALVCDTLMIMGSSVPTESASSDSGDIVSGNQARMSDENIEQ